MTLSQLYKKGSKDSTDPLTNISAQKPSETTKLPWWASFKKKGNKNTKPTTLEQATTETYQPVSSETVSSGPDEIAGNTMRTTTQASQYIQFSSSALFETEISTNIVGKLLNVSGKLIIENVNNINKLSFRLILRQPV